MISDFATLLAQAQTPAIPPMPWTELAGFLTFAGVVAGGVFGVLHMWLGKNYISRGECEFRKNALEINRTAALIRLTSVEQSVKDHNSHLTRIEGHLEAVDTLALRQTEIEKSALLSEQPIREFAAWMDEVKEMLRSYIKSSEETKLDHETRLAVLETTIQIAERKRRQHLDDSGNPVRA